MDNTTVVHEIAEAAASLFPPRVPPLLPDFTDHGPEHSRAVFDYAEQILEANGGRPLSADEEFLLEAAAYLHDIGMQCDVARAQDVLKLAAGMGARFPVEFTASTASSYSHQEQQAIRQNHNFLSAAMLEVARDAKTTKLGRAVSGIPPMLFEELVRICLYHSGLPITECPTAYASNIRTQLLAGILRLADDLDVTTRRAETETTKQFAFPSESMYYRALHGMTDVQFIGAHVILIRVGLHSDDAGIVGDAIQRRYIDAIIQKSTPVISVLRQNGFMIAFGVESRVVVIRGAERLPSDVIAFLLSEDQRPPAAELADELISWFEALGYEASQLICTEKGFVAFSLSLLREQLSHVVAVRCYEGEITLSDIRSAEAEDSREMWCVADSRVHPDAREYCKKSQNVRVYTLSDALRMVWRPYVDSLEAELTKQAIEERYVDLSCAEAHDEREERSAYGSLDAYVESWIRERGREQICLLGEFGAGKTWFCRHLASRQLKQFFAAPQSNRFPLLITLRDYSKSTSAEQLVNHVLLEKYRLQLVGSAFRVVTELARRGKLLLILDGFDEMARKVDKQAMVENFGELTRLIAPNGKVLLTARTEYFQSLEEAQELLARGTEMLDANTLIRKRDRASGTADSIGEKVPNAWETVPAVIGRRKTRFETVSILPLSEEQISAIIRKIKGPSEGKKALDVVLGTSGIAEMATKPVMIELLLASLEETDSRSLETHADVYLHSTHRLLLRNIREGRTFTTTSDKLRFLGDLAWYMVREGQFRMHFKEFATQLTQSIGDRVQDTEIDYWKRDFQAQTMLHRDATGNYEFMHRSVAEYFAALRLGLEAGIVAERFLKTYVEAQSAPCLPPYKQFGAKELSCTLGAIPFSSDAMLPIKQFLLNMLGGRTVQERLLSFIRAARSAEFAYLGGNALTLLFGGELVPQGFQADSVALAGASLVGARMNDFRFTNSSFKYADLRGCSFTGKALEGGHLEDTHLRIFFSGFAHELVDRVPTVDGTRGHGIPEAVEGLGRKFEARAHKHDMRFQISNTGTIGGNDEFVGYWNVLASGSLDGWASVQRSFHQRFPLRLALFSDEVDAIRESRSALWVGLEASEPDLFAQDR